MSHVPKTDAPRRWLRALGVGAAGLLVGTILAVPNGPSASATADDEAAFVAGLNQVRAGVGLPPLAVNSELTVLSRQHSQVMADAGSIFHADPISGGFTGSWQKMGENVGVGANVQVLIDAFVASPGHYANIVDPSFGEVGVGVVWKDGALYTTHRFVQSGDPPPATTTAAPSTATTPGTAPPTTSTPSTPSTTTPSTATGQGDSEAPPEPAPSRPAVTKGRIEAILELLDLIGT